ARLRKRKMSGVNLRAAIDKAKSSRPSLARAWQRSLLWLRILAIAAGIAFAVQLFLVPIVVRYAVSRALTGLGFPEASFQLRATSLFRTLIEDVDLHSPRPARIGSIRVSHTPLSLLSGRVNTITLTGAEVEIAIRDGQADLSALGLTRAGRDQGKTQSTRPDS